MLTGRKQKKPLPPQSSTVVETQQKVDAELEKSNLSRSQLQTELNILRGAHQTVMATQKTVDAKLEECKQSDSNPSEV
jgi:hypothetical protein